MNTENWQWPQYLIASMTVINLLLAAHFHGKPREGKHNFFLAMASTVLLTGFVLYSGGFWK
jgi:hypothetical protein